MPFYLYRCTSEKCQSVLYDKRSMNKRDDPGVCPICGEETKRTFDKNSGNIIMWRNPNSTRATTSGPTRKNKYTVGNFAEEKGWYENAWGIKRPIHKSQ